MSPLRWLWLALAALGALAPLLALAARLSGEAGAPWWRLGPSLVAPDQAVATLTLIVFVLAETYVRKNWPALLVIPAALVGGVGFGLPLYLFVRARPVR